MSPTVLSFLAYFVGLLQGCLLAWVLLRNPFARFASGGYIHPSALPPFTDDLTKYADAALLKVRAEHKAKQDAKWKAFMANPTGGWRGMGQGGVIPGNDAGPAINQQLRIDVQAGSWMDEGALRKALSPYERRKLGL